jgi:hypothetical protein
MTGPMAGRQNLKIKNYQDFWAGLLFAGVGLLFAIGASNHELGDSQAPGPGYFPLLLGLLMIALGCLLNFKALTFETDDGAPVGRIAWRGLSAVLISIVLAGLTLPLFGMLVTIPVLAYILGLASGRFSALRWLTTSLVSAATCWLVFGYMLNLPLALLPAHWG